jgi:NADH-quinone oxidoreductase subunit N
MFFFFIRFFFYNFYVYFIAWQKILMISSVGSLFIGCVGSIGQNRLKKLFAYASISQLGFSLLGLLVGTVEGIQLSFFFFLIYIITSLGILVILLNTDSYLKGYNLVSISDLTKLGHTNNIVAISMSIMLLSMAGIPPLAGFFSKYLIFKLLIESSFY